MKRAEAASDHHMCTIACRSLILNSSLILALEVQLEAAAGGRPEGLLGVVAEVGALQAAMGRCKREGVRTSRHPPVGQRRSWPRSTQRAGTWATAAGSLCAKAVYGLCGVRG